MTAERLYNTMDEERFASEEASDGWGTRALLLVRSTDLVFQPDGPYFWKDCIYPGALSGVYGPTGAGKTNFALYVAHRIATGQPLFGRRVTATRVLLVALEGAASLPKRVAAVQSQYGLAPDLFVYAQPFRLLEHGEAERLSAAILQHDIGLCIIDTLSRTLPGLNENDGDTMSRLVGALDVIRARTKAHMMVVHHPGKDEDRGMRGHSALPAAADLILRIRKLETGIRSVEIEKARDHAGGEIGCFSLRVVELGFDADGDPVTSCYVEELSDRPPAREAGKSKAKALSSAYRNALSDLKRLLEDAQHVQRTAPRPGMPMVDCVRREALRDLMQENGRFDEPPGTPLSPRSRGRLRDALGALEAHGLALSTNEWVWCP
tara:strand:- start:2962 stop:4095 length:1134 start_codon:yes stop_codon:yes gene_type:complete